MYFKCLCMTWLASLKLCAATAPIYTVNSMAQLRGALVASDAELEVMCSRTLQLFCPAPTPS